MFKKIVNGCVNVVNRWLPDPFLFAVILTIVVFIAGMAATGLNPVQMVGFVLEDHSSEAGYGVSDHWKGSASEVAA